MRTIPLLHLDRSGYVEAAGIYGRCSRHGFSASTTDCQIAAAAIHHDCRLLTADRDFERIADVSQLQLL